MEMVKMQYWIEQAPWYTVEADDKRRARLNRIAHILSMVPYEDDTPPPLELPPRRPPDEKYVRPPKSDQHIVPDVELCRGRTLCRRPFLR